MTKTFINLELHEVNMKTCVNIKTLFVIHQHHSLTCPEPTSFIQASGFNGDVSIF